ncbi:MAG: inositol monophosphatase family protein, partial [Candidatus Aminicenantia bacterium]
MNSSNFSKLREEIIENAKRIALDAGKILKKRFGKSNRITFKGDINLVTEADFLSQDFIKKSIRDLYPHHSILSEEGLEIKSNSPFRWVIDPLDGTTNFAHGLPIFSISIAVEYEGKIFAGVVYNPFLNELFWAEIENGAFLGKRRIRVSRTKALNRSLLATGFPYDIREDSNNNLDNFSKFALRAQAIRRMGSAAIDLCYVACGRFDGFWELKLFPWDVAAGILIVEEAGGEVSDFKGKSIDLYSKEIVASNGLIHDEMIE